MGLSATLRKRADPLWRRVHAHPFVRGLGDGSLPVVRFTFYLRQDYLFLIEYCRVLAIASAKAPDLAGMTKFGELLHDTLTQEMDLHRSYCATFGISARQLERTRAAPANLAYTSYLLRVAYEGSMGEIVAALLPCQWGYSEIGLELARTGDTSQRNRYAGWIKTYASVDFARLADWLRGYLDLLARGVSATELRRVEEAYVTSARYEYQFWEMAWKKERWGV